MYLTAGAREISNAREVTRNEVIVEVIYADEDIVELRPEDHRPRWLTVLMRRGGHKGVSLFRLYIDVIFDVQ